MYSVDTVKVTNSPILTWVVPVYNGEKYIRQTIGSILRQPCNDFEIIVVDDGSTDNTPAIVKNYNSQKLRYIQKENGGVSTARNLGIDAVKSKYIAFLDADDILCKDAYTEDVHALLSCGEYDLYSFSFYSADQDLARGNHIPAGDPEAADSRMKLDPFKHCSSFIYARDLLNKIKPIRFPQGIKIREDVTFQFLVYQRADKICSIDRNWFIYRNNITSVLHRNTDCDYLIHHAIPAWQWCKNECEKTEEKAHCNIRIFAETAEYLRLGCMTGKPLAEISQYLALPAIQEAMADYSILWSSSKQEYEKFTENPKKYWRKYRIIGLVSSMMKRIVRVPLFRILYFRLKYREQIEYLVDC